MYHKPVRRLNNPSNGRPYFPVQSLKREITNRSLFLSNPSFISDARYGYKSCHNIELDLLECENRCAIDTEAIVAIVSSLFILLTFIFGAWYLGYVKGKSKGTHEIHDLMEQNRKKEIWEREKQVVGDKVRKSYPTLDTKNYQKPSPEWLGSVSRPTPVFREKSTSSKNVAEAKVQEVKGIEAGEAEDPVLTWGLYEKWYREYYDSTCRNYHKCERCRENMTYEGREAGDSYQNV